MTATKVVEVRQEYRYIVNTQHIFAVILICSICIFLSMSLCLISSYWITSHGFRQGLLYLCIEEPDLSSRIRNEPLPFDLSREQLDPGCYPNRDKGYLKFCTFLCLITQLSAIASAILTGYCMRLRGLSQLKCLKAIICTTLVTFTCDLILIITYPTQFAEEIDKSNRDLWELNGAFGLACGSAILSLGTLTLLIVALHKISTILRTIPTRI